jgi:class 3 adenylate cyclase/CheY-like chemotaxis protein
VTSHHWRLLVVDDDPNNCKLLEAILAPHGYAVRKAKSGREALDSIAAGPPDLVLLDIVMPELSGYEVCRQLRDGAATRALPVIMLTSSGDQDKVRAIEAGADDFIARPFDQMELLARVRSLLRIKEYHDTIQAQAAELANWNALLETRVKAQVDELERLDRLRRFLSPQVAEVVLSTDDEGLLQSHRREITVVFCELRGFTNFSETAEPEEVMAVLAEFHRELGRLIFQFDGTLERFAGDAMMIVFNDPLPCPDPPLRAVRMAVAMQERMADLSADWRKRGHELALVIGIALGYATLGRIGFEGRSDYGAVGNVVNVAASLCGEAQAGQILLAQSVFAAVEPDVTAKEAGPIQLKGLQRSTTAYLVVGMNEPENAEDSGPLSRRQQEVAALVGAGLTNREIAERLFIAERSAEGHVERIRNKLGVHSRTEITLWAVQHGLISPGGRTDSEVR